MGESGGGGPQQILRSRQKRQAMIGFFFGGCSFGGGTALWSLNIACPSFASDSETGISSIPEPSSCDASAARLNGGALSGTVEVALSGEATLVDFLESTLVSRLKSVLTGASEGRVRVAPFSGAEDDDAWKEWSLREKEAVPIETGTLTVVEGRDDVVAGVVGVMGVMADSRV